MGKRVAFFWLPYRKLIRANNFDSSGVKETENKMENENCRTRSVLEGNNGFVSKILTRNASRSCSSRMLFRKCQVPFQWESQPGKPKHQPPPPSLKCRDYKAQEDDDDDGEEDEGEFVPSRAPSVQASLHVPKKSRFWLWSKLKKSRKLNVFLKYVHGVKKCRHCWFIHSLTSSSIHDHWSISMPHCDAINCF